MNALAGKTVVSGSAVGPWDSANAESLIRYTVKKNYTMYAWELGKFIDFIHITLPHVKNPDLEVEMAISTHYLRMVDLGYYLSLTGQTGKMKELAKRNRSNGSKFAKM